MELSNILVCLESASLIKLFLAYRADKMLVNFLLLPENCLCEKFFGHVGRHKVSKSACYSQWEDLIYW